MNEDPNNPLSNGQNLDTSPTNAKPDQVAANPTSSVSGQINVNQPTTSPVQNTPPTSHKSKSLKSAIIGIVAFLLGCALTSLIFLVFINEPQTQTNDQSSEVVVTSTEMTDFTDPNFTMKIPKSWNSDAGYEPGSTLVAYYSPEDTSDANRDKAYNLAVYVASQESRIDDQIEGMKNDNVEYKILTDESFEEEGTSLRYVELEVSTPEQPDRVLRIASVTAIKGDFIINADVAGLNEYWDLHKEVVPQMLKSIRPACDNPNLDIQNSASAVDLCQS